MQLVQVVASFARRATGDFTLDGLLHDLAVAAVKVLAIDGAGVSYRTGDRLEVVHVLPSFLEPVEDVQEQDQEGPCHDAVRDQAPIVEGELAEHNFRWPRFAARALEAGVNAVASLPLLARGQVWGAIDLYRRAAGPFDVEQLAAAQMLVDVACGYVVMAHDRRLAQDAQEQAAHLATHDVLTGLPNRALLYDRLHHAVATTARNGQGVAVVFLDLDGFKAVNDTHGHHAGDELLRQVAARLSGAVRKGDTLARWGGDEFVVVCESLHRTHHRADRVGLSHASGELEPEVATAAGGGDNVHGEVEVAASTSTAADANSGPVVDEHALEVILDRLRSCLSDPFALPLVGGGGGGGSGTQAQTRVLTQVQVAASIGAAAVAPIAGGEQESAERLLRAADEAMYRAKRARTVSSERLTASGSGVVRAPGAGDAQASKVIFLDSVVHVLALDTHHDGAQDLLPNHFGDFSREHR